MNQIMQKQRSPYTGGGGFNVTQLKTTVKFNNTEGLNQMPFLVELAKQVQHCTPPPQPFSKPGSAAAGNERGQRSGTPRDYTTDNNNNNNNYSNNNHYEGGIPYSSNPNQGQPDDSLDYHFEQTGYETNEPLDPEFMKKLKEMSFDAIVDTDSESEYCQHQKEFGARCTGKAYWRRAFNYLKSRMPLQRQERMELALRKSHAHTVLDHVLLLLQLLGILLIGTVGQGLLLGINFGQTSYRLWRCKFQLRGLVRQFLWRMANAKGNDVFLFLGLLLITPWLFFISLIGFMVAILFHVKLGFEAFWRQVRLRILR